MTKITHIFFFALSICLLAQSCVDRITIPDDEINSLVLHCEMVKGQKKVVATLETSSNLKGTQPIIVPEDAIIEISTGTEVPSRLTYDPDIKKYTTNDFYWPSVRNLNIIAEIPDDRYKKISAAAVVEGLNTIESIVVKRDSMIDADDEVYYQKEIEIVLAEPKKKPAFFELDFFEKFTLKTTDELGNVEYTQTGEYNYCSIESVTKGGIGIVNMEHDHGLLIDMSRLTDNTFTVLLTSPYPLAEENQVFEQLRTSLNSVSHEFYQYHKSYSNTVSGDTDGNYVDPAIFLTNIKDGFGLFSVMNMSPQDHTL